MTASLTNLRSALLQLASAGLVVVFSLVLPGCAPQPTSKRAPAVSLAAVGEIAVVNLAGRFVLIDLQQSRALLPAGAELKVRSSTEEESARLRVTPERKHPFITADIVSGTPARGDKVYR